MPHLAERCGNRSMPEVFGRYKALAQQPQKHSVAALALDLSLGCLLAGALRAATIALAVLGGPPGGSPGRRRTIGRILLAQHVLVGHASLVLLPRHGSPAHLTELPAARHWAVVVLALLRMHLQQHPHAPARQTADRFCHQGALSLVIFLIRCQRNHSS